MGIIKTDDIIAYQFDTGLVELVCTECTTPDELKDLKADQIIQESARDDSELLFCDRCKDQI